MIKGEVKMKIKIDDDYGELAKTYTKEKEEKERGRG